MSAEFTLADLYRRFSRMIRDGTVHSVQASPPRCRVTFGSDPKTGKEHLTDWLPWYAHSDAERQDWSMPAVGAAATVLSAGGETTGGIVFAGLITDDQTPAGSAPTEHVTRYSDGAVVSYDTASHAMVVGLPDGGTVRVVGPGGITLDGPVRITKTLKVAETIEAEGNISSAGDIAAAGDISDQGNTASSMAKIREVYNSHSHNETDDITEPPNEKL
ncbi:phage baseplate assembly protein V [Klebsiella aerogenes]|uniref:phage baseplate assembly protein V n=1 Tax=Klebsiella aerogenes TaxID=548 RepID=UPI0034D32ED8